MRPRVGIDAHFLSRLSGNRTYVLALLRALARAGSGERFDIRVFSLEPSRDAALVEGFAWEPLPSSAALRFGVAIPRARRSVDLWHATFVASGSGPLVLAVHDALALTRPSLLPWSTATKLRLLLPRSIRAAGAVLVPTSAVKHDLDALGLGARARVAPIGIDTSTFHPLEGAASDYVLAVGRPDPRKRLDVIARAARRAGRALVVAGPVEAVPGATRTVRSPDERALADLYRGARALVFASAGEGLGLPVLEALACGTPVIATNIPPLREAAGDAALALIPPDDEAALARAIARAFEIGPEERARLAALGAAQVARYSLEAMALATERAWLDALG